MHGTEYGDVPQSDREFKAPADNPSFESQLSDNTAMREAPSKEEVARQAGFERAKQKEQILGQIKSAQSFSQVRGIIDGYNRQFDQRSSEDVMLAKLEGELFLDGNEYELQTVNGTNLELLKLKQFKKDDTVKIERNPKGSGKIEDGWKIDSFFSEVKKGKITRVAIVTKEDGFNRLEKTADIDELRRLNGKYEQS